MRTADLLYERIQMDELPPVSVLADYFGFFNWPHDLFDNPDKSNQRISVLYGVYRGLWLLDITADELDNHFRDNKLDELIHTTYQQKQSVFLERRYTAYLSYYKTFCDNNMSVGNTYYTNLGE
jgi:hypothetical protein